MRAENIMRRNFASLREGQKVSELLAALVENNANGMPVINERGELAGIVTDGDVFRAIKTLSANGQVFKIAKSKYQQETDFFSFFSGLMEKDEVSERLKEFFNKPVSEIMTKSGLFTFAPDESIDKILAVFAQSRFKEVPVAEEGKGVVGMIARSEVVSCIAKELLKNE